MAERLGLPVFVDNDGNAAALAEHRAGAARGATRGDRADARDRHRRRADPRAASSTAARSAPAAELGHMVIDIDGPALPGQLPQPRLRRGASPRARRSPARRERLAGEPPRLRAGRGRSRDGRELAGPLVTELAHDGDAAAIEAIELIGARLGVGDRQPVNIFNPEVVVIGGGVIAAGELLLGPARAEVAERALPPSRDEVRIVAARFGVEAGMVGAAALAFDGLARRAAAA